MKEKLTNAELEMLGFDSCASNTTSSNTKAKDNEPRVKVILTAPKVGMFVKVGNEFGMIDGYYPDVKQYGFVTSDRDSWTGRLVSPSKIEECDVDVARAAAIKYYTWESEHLRRRIAMNSGNKKRLADLIEECEAWLARLK